MTRDEALSKVQLACIQGEAQGLIKSLENLGLLKLDEPKSKLKPRHIIAMSFAGSYSNWESADRAIENLAASGFEIVEK
jgi:hypothetical protein